MTTRENPSSDPATDLEKLAVELDARGLDTTITAPVGRLPYLTARNRDTSSLTETILTDRGFFWWSWAERIGPADDVTAAANRVAHVLAAEPDGGA
jgi:hypothetical protein